MACSNSHSHPAPAPQAGLLLAASALYLAYLRLVVPYSRGEEMLLEYWAALLDLASFALATVSPASQLCRVCASSSGPTTRRHWWAGRAGPVGLASWVGVPSGPRSIE